MREIKLKQETAIGQKTDIMNWIAETKEQKATRELIYQVIKSLKILWLVEKIPFLKYKDWVKIRIDRDKTKENKIE